MDFNPLDLLASAAELQQKHDNGPERIIVTRQKRNSTSTTKHIISNVGQKENREVHKSNNNNHAKTKAKPSVVIVKKIKVENLNSDLEKMFDEHNYGNWKKTNYKYEQNDENGSDINKRKKQNNGQCHSSSCEIVSSKPESSESKVRTKLISVGSQASDSDSECVGKCSLNCSKDKSTCPSTGSHCSGNRTVKTNCTHENETTENKCTNCVEIVCNCGTSAGEQSDSEGQTEVNSSFYEDKHEETSLMKYREVQKQGEYSELLKSDEDCLKLDDKTGEFITESSAEVKTLQAEKINKEAQKETHSSEKNLEIKPLRTDEEKVVHRMVALKNAKNLKHDSTTVKSTSIITSAKMPYVKVIPSKEICSEAVIDKQSETSVINISRGHNSSSQLTKSVSGDQSSLQSKTNNMCGVDNTNEPSDSGNSVGIIKSVVIEKLDTNKSIGEINDKSKPIVLSMLSKKSKLEMPKVDSSKFHASSSYGTLKSLELSDTICLDESVSSIHLLSPDRRNPDSMGIADSPVIQNCDDLCSDGKEKDKVTFPFPSSKSVTNKGAISERGGNSKSIKIDKSPECSSSVIRTNGSLDSNSSDCLLDLDENTRDCGSDTKELMEESRLDPGNTTNDSDNCANDAITDSSGNEVPIFRTDLWTDTDHCYAGVPISSRASIEIAKKTTSDDAKEACTLHSSTSASVLSQDSGYEDVGQSPESEMTSTQSTSEEQPLPCSEKTVVKNLVPVLVSVNTNGSLTLHDTNFTKALGGNILALPENLSSINSGLKVIQGTSVIPVSQPFILSPVGKSSSPLLTEGSLYAPAKSKGPESVIDLLCSKPKEQSNVVPVLQTNQPVSPPKFGTFKIGTFASFSSSGMGLERSNSVPMEIKSNMDTVEEKTKKSLPRPRSNSGKSFPTGSDSLSNLVQKVKGSLSQSQNLPKDGQGLDHIQHDHDYCTKNLMPSVVSSLLEARLLSKDTGKGKLSHGKGKKIDADQMQELQKSESKSLKRKRNSVSLTKLDSMDEFDVDSESDTQSVPEQTKSKSRMDKFLEKPGRPTDPKVKITGSSNFQDQFVYFMNTKKRSRRRESKDTPLALGDRVLIPPKPGDIVVPHLSDQDIENLKQRSKQFKQSGNMSAFNSLRNEFMAAKYANTPYSGLFTSGYSTEQTAVVDEEKNIINTILSMENENLVSPVQSSPPPYNESMELYGQGVGNDIMSLLPEQMNLTQEQMDLLYSAVDEVQNSSPGLIGAEKLVSSKPGEGSFSQFPVPEFDDDDLSQGSDRVGATETVTMEASDDVEQTETKSDSDVTGEKIPESTVKGSSPVESGDGTVLVTNKDSNNTTLNEASAVTKTDGECILVLNANTCSYEQYWL